MVEYSKLTLTAKGAALNAKMIAGQTGFTFTKVCASDTAYTEVQLPDLTSLSDIKQTSLVSKVTRSNNVTITIEAAFTNTSLSTGYYMRTLGLYALDPTEGEILYAACVAGSDNCYMPPNNGVTSSGAFIKLIQTVGNADNVSLNVDPGAVATIGDIQALEKEIADLKGFVGYTDSDIYGIEADFKNKKFTRLAGAENLTPGTAFDGINAFGGRKRCILADDGTVLAYYGDDAYTTSGKLTQAVTVGSNTYTAGTNVQVMVEQPKFYYKMIPLEVEKIEKGWLVRKARWYVCDTPKYGFKLHPLFKRAGKEKEKVYLSAFEGSLWDASSSMYVMNNAQIADFNADMLSSISGAIPGSYKSPARESITRKLAQNRGTGWEQQTVQAVSATQLLMIIEYAAFNMRSAISAGYSSKHPASNYMAEATGATANLGNATGEVINENGLKLFSYRGEENFYGNIWKQMDGLNKKERSIYIADHSFEDDTDSGAYEDAGICAAEDFGYISAFCYSEKYDWLFFPAETKGDSKLPVGDFYRIWDSSRMVTRLGGDGTYTNINGAFSLSFVGSSSDEINRTGGRLLYIPGVDLAEEAA